jgi:DNA-binding NtrC family response regulator
MSRNFPSVLIVDDEALIRWSLCELLSEGGYAVTAVGDGGAALRAIAQSVEPFDVVLLDYRLPDSSDLTLLTQIRAAAPHARVIMITAHDSQELAQGAKALGVYRVISKPFEMDAITSLVQQASIT